MVICRITKCRDLHRSAQKAVVPMFEYFIALFNYVPCKENSEEVIKK